jgi:glycosyltransferase involved in cell wall biosynthesis
MRVGVSGWRLAGQPLGVSRYIEYVLKRWHGMLRPSEEVTVYVTEPIEASRRASFDGFRVEEVRPRLTNALWENLLLPRRATDLDVLFGPSYTLPLTYRGRTVVAIHSADEAGKLFPHWKYWSHEQKYKWSARKANRVIVNAHVVKAGIMESYGIPEEKIDVVWLAAGEAFRPLNDPELVRATRRKFLGADRPYVLFVGGLSKRRNVPLLMAAFGALKKRAKLPHALLLVGPNRSNIPLAQLAGELGITDSFVQTDGRFGSHQELAAVYNAADVFVLPSSSEGFSLTTAEAMACGTPIVTVNHAGLGEMANGYAMMLESPKVELLTDALHQLLTDETLRLKIGAQCLERSKVFSWDTTARRTLDILRTVANGEG